MKSMRSLNYMARETKCPRFQTWAGPKVGIHKSVLLIYP